jgi:hypothetical protein
VSAFTDSISFRIDQMAKPAVAASFKATPPPTGAVTMAKALLAAREAQMPGSTMAFDIAGGVLFSWAKPQIAVLIKADAVVLFGGLEAKATFSAIDAGFLAAFDAMFAPAVTS